MNTTDHSTVTVVIPLFNKRNYVRQALDSVLNQTWPAGEILVVDDGSTDGSGDVAAEYEPAVTVIRKKNGGASAARNRGIASARNELVAFLDADDQWKPHFLEKVSRLLARFPEACAAGSAYEWLVAPGLTRKLVNALPIPKPQWEGVIDYFACLAAGGAPPLNSSTAIVRTRAIRAIGGFPEGQRWGEDHDTWARLALIGPIAFTTDILCTVNVVAADRASDSPDPRPALPAIDTVLKALSTTNNESRRAHLQQYLISLVFGSALMNLRYGHAGEARRQLLLYRSYVRVSPRWIGLLAGTFLPPAALRFGRTAWNRLRKDRRFDDSADFDNYSVV